MTVAKELNDVLLSMVSIISQDIPDDKESLYDFHLYYDWEKEMWCFDYDFLWDENPNPNEEEEEEENKSKVPSREEIEAINSYLEGVITNSSKCQNCIFCHHDHYKDNKDFCFFGSACIYNDFLYYTNQE